MKTTYYFTVPSYIENSGIADYLRKLMQNKRKLNVYIEREEALLVTEINNPRILLMIIDDEFNELNRTQVYSEEQEFICFGSAQYFKDNCMIWE